MTSWVWPKSTSGLRSCRARSGMAASSSARTSLSEPLKARPMGVRMASTMTASGMWRATLCGLQHHGVRQAARLAHGLQGVAGAPLGLRVDGRGGDAGAGRAERVADRDRTAVDVDLVQRDGGFALPGEDDRAEGLVDLEQVDVVDGQAGVPERLRG